MIDISILSEIAQAMIREYNVILTQDDVNRLSYMDTDRQCKWINSPLTQSVIENLKLSN